MSACATMPQQVPRPSITGSRRTWLISIDSQHSSRVVSGVTVTTGDDIQSRATWGMVVPGPQHTGSLVMMSRTFISDLLLAKRCVDRPERTRRIGFARD